MDILTISEALRHANIWHKIQSRHVCTKRTHVKIPEINDMIAYLAGVVAGDGNLNVCRRKKEGTTTK